MERRRLRLRRRRAPEHLRRPRLVEARLEVDLADRLENPDGAEPDDVARVFRNVERDAHVRLRPEVVDFFGLERVEQFHHLHRVREIAVVEV